MKSNACALLALVLPLSWHALTRSWESLPFFGTILVTVGGWL